MSEYINRFYIDETNEEFGPVVRWNSNDRIPPKDVLKEFLSLGLIDGVVLDNSILASSKELSKFLESYRSNYRGPSQEEILEARAEFGPGARIVNVITGTSYTV